MRGGLYRSRGTFCPVLPENLEGDGLGMVWGWFLPRKKYTDTSNSVKKGT